MNSSSGYYYNNNNNNYSTTRDSNGRYTNNMASAPSQRQGYSNSYVADAKVSSPNLNRTAKEIENEEEEDDDDDNNDDNVYNEDQLKFFQDLVDGRRKLNGDDPYWEMKAELSGNLGKLFNKQAKYRGDESYWERPATYGLENSAPIIATKYNVHAKTNSSDENRMFRAEAKETVNTNKPQTKTLYEMVQQGGVTYDSVAKNNGIRSVIDRDENISRNNNKKYANYSNEEDEEEGGDDEEYDEDGEEEDEEEEDDENVLGGLMNSTGLSPNLMALLGMEVTAAPVATDWKPPERAGLDNSDALVAKQKLRAMKNGIMTVNEN